MDPEPGTLQDSQDFCAETRDRSSGQSLAVTVPPSGQDSSPWLSRRARPDPSHWAGGVSAWPSLPGSLCRCWLRKPGQELELCPRELQP